MKGQMRRREGGVGMRPGSVQGGWAKTQRPCAGASSACGRIRERGGARDIPRSGGGLHWGTVRSIVGADDARKCRWMRGGRGSLLAMDGRGGRNDVRTGR